MQTIWKSDKNKFLVRQIALFSPTKCDLVRNFAYLVRQNAIKYEKTQLSPTKCNLVRHSEYLIQCHFIFSPTKCILVRQNAI
jgi:hypothetical protein